MNPGVAPSVLHVTEDMAAMGGGVPAVVRQLSRRLAASGSQVGVVHVTGDACDLDDVVQVAACPPSRLGRPWWHGPTLGPTLQRLIAPPAASGPVVHLHGVWAAPQLLAAHTARRAGAPWVFTAHGMLEPWLWHQQGVAVWLKKQAYWRGLAAPALRHATVVHAITPLERDHLRALLPGNRIEVIPNAIDVPPQPDVPQALDRMILFVGRIDPVKGVDILVRAFSEARLASDWVLNIVGPAWSPAYMDSLKQLVQQLDIGHRVHFLGPKHGAEKQQLLNSAWVMAVPSHSEVVALVNLEAAERQLPSITTHPTGLVDWQDGGGLLVNPDVLELTSALRQACAWSDQERSDRGRASWQLLRRRYSWDAVLPLWHSLYLSTMGISRQ